MAMDRAHTTLIKDVLRDVWSLGAATVELRLIYRWYNMDRLTKSVWTDLLAKWDEIAEEDQNEEGWRLGYIDHGRTDILTLICLDPENADESHIKPLSDRIN